MVTLEEKLKKYKFRRSLIISKNHINFIDCVDHQIFFNNNNSSITLNDEQWKQFKSQWLNEKSDYITIWEKISKESE